MSRYWSDVVSTLTPYVPGEQPKAGKLVKLNTNESPYPPSPQVLQAIRAVSADALRLYPDPESVALAQAIATRNAIQPEQVFVGNGSDEVLALVFMALLKHSQPLYFPDISYSFYPVWAELYGIDYVRAPVADDFSVNPDAYPAENGGIILPNPNAPTGILMSLEAIRVLLKKSAGSVVVIDEAYIDFGGESAVSLIDEFDNLLVVQTLSKSRALAGMRVGFAMGNQELIAALGRVKNSFNSYPLDVISQHAALASIQDEEYFRQSCQRVINSRQSLCSELAELGFEVLPSGANFVFATHAVHGAADLFTQLRARGIVVRYFDKPRIENYLRISIGTEEDNAALLVALKEILS
ncbi:Histidinol-phosphate aminotransferase [Halioglobus japonicus]|nr:Histidinol-phosphate aminotransferase [Halioglobus japonicus]